MNQALIDATRYGILDYLTRQQEETDISKEELLVALQEARREAEAWDK